MSISAIGSNSAVSSPYSVESQDRAKPPSIDVIVAQLTSQLNLTSDQAASLKQIIQKDKPDGDNDSDKSSGMKSPRVVMDQLSKDILSILNSDQQKIFEKLQSQRQAGHHLKKDTAKPVDGSTSATSTTTLATTKADEDASAKKTTETFDDLLATQIAAQSNGNSNSLSSILGPNGLLV